MSTPSICGAVVCAFIGSAAVWPGSMPEPAPAFTKPLLTSRRSKNGREGRSAAGRRPPSGKVSSRCHSCKLCRADCPTANTEPTSKASSRKHAASATLHHDSTSRRKRLHWPGVRASFAPTRSILSRPRSRCLGLYTLRPLAELSSRKEACLPHQCRRIHRQAKCGCLRTSQSRHVGRQHSVSANHRSCLPRHKHALGSRLLRLHLFWRESRRQRDNQH